MLTLRLGVMIYENLRPYVGPKSDCKNSPFEGDRTDATTSNPR